MNAVIAKLRELEPPARAGTHLRLAGLVDRLELKEGYEGEHTAAVSGLAAEGAESTAAEAADPAVPSSKR